MATNLDGCGVKTLMQLIKNRLEANLDLLLSTEAKLDQGGKNLKELELGLVVRITALEKEVAALQKLLIGRRLDYLERKVGMKPKDYTRNYREEVTNGETKKEKSEKKEKRRGKERREKEKESSF